MPSDEMVEVVAGALRKRPIDCMSAEEIALAAIEAVRPLIRAEVLREAAALARAERARLKLTAKHMADRPEIYGDAAREREIAALTADDIEQSILALIGEDSVSRSPVGQLATAMTSTAEELRAILALAEETDR